MTVTETSIYTHGFTPSADLLILIENDNLEVNHAAIMDTLIAIRGPVSKVGDALLYAWKATNVFSDSRGHATRTAEGVARSSTKSSGGSWSSRGGNRTSHGNAVGRDVVRFDTTRTLQAAAVREFAVETIAALQGALTDAEQAAVADCANELAARAEFIAACLPLCEHEMTVAQRTRAQLLAPAFVGLAKNLKALAAAL